MFEEITFQSPPDNVWKPVIKNGNVTNYSINVNGIVKHNKRKTPLKRKKHYVGSDEYFVTLQNVGLCRVSKLLIEAFKEYTNSPLPSMWGYRYKDGNEENITLDNLVVHEEIRI
jgi:hypothetical protein